MRGKGICIAMLLALSAPAASAQEVWPLEACIAYARDNRIDVARQRNAVELQRVKLQAASRSYLPVAEVDVTPAFSHGMNMDIFVNADFLYLPASLQTYMPLLDLGIRSRRQAESYGLQAAGERLRQLQQQTAIAVTTYYMQAAYAKSMAALAREMVAIDNENLTHVQTGLADGAAAESELLRAQLALASDEKALAVAEGQASQALLELRCFMHCPDSFDVEAAAGPALDAVPPDTSADAGIAASRLELLSSQWALKNARSARYPSLTLHAALGGFTYAMLNTSGELPYDQSFWNNRNAVVWLNLCIPIINLQGTRSAVKAGEVEVADRQLALDQAVSEYGQKMAMLRTKIATGRETATRMDAVVATAEQLYLAEKERYDGGYSGWLELQEAKRQYRQARAEQLNNSIQLAMNSRMLAIYSGTQQ